MENVESIKLILDEEKLNSNPEKLKDIKKVFYKRIIK